MTTSGTGRSPGSSPLTRGKQERPHYPAIDAGLIPAHAGKTAHMGEHRRDLAAHPRSRGENARVREAGASASGSSPLTRGKRQGARARRGVHRLIPAHAGKTGGVWLGCGAYAAHPRSRGENRMACHSGQSGVGSSPLTRGKLHAHVSRESQHGLIPAHAGKTREN